MPKPKANSGQRMKKFPVCACKLNRDTCDVCGEGFVQRCQNGLVPHFVEVEVPQRFVPVCACDLERQTCPDCQKGYVEIVQKGEVPRFKTVYDDHLAQLPDPKGQPDILYIINFGIMI